MLTGQLGNGGVSWSGGMNYIYYLFTGNQWRKGWRAFDARRKNLGMSWFRAFKSQLLRPVLAPVRYEYQRFLHQIKQSNLLYSFPRGDFIRRMGFHNSTDMIMKRMDPLTERMLTTMDNGTMAGTLWHSVGSFYRMDIRDPTADVRLLEYCMGVPDEQDTFAGGERMLIRRAMNGILPDAVRWNSIRGRQAADAVLRLIDQQNDIDREIIRLESSPEVTQYLDIEAMKRAWKTILLKNWTSERVDALLRSINNSHFLLSLSV
jgi:asparagine synthase (glutamine-hydrolysing)